MQETDEKVIYFENYLDITLHPVTSFKSKSIWDKISLQMF